MTRLRACCVTQAPVRVGRDAGDAHAPARQLDEKQDVEALQLRYFASVSSRLPNSFVACIGNATDGFLGNRASLTVTDVLDKVRAPNGSSTALVAQRV
jgi:hypothetical protein